MGSPPLPFVRKVVDTCCHNLGVEPRRVRRCQLFRMVVVRGLEFPVSLGVSLLAFVSLSAVTLARITFLSGFVGRGYTCLFGDMRSEPALKPSHPGK